MAAKVAVVTGASTGIGREVARALGHTGWRVLMVSRDPGRAAAALAEVRQSGAEAESIVADLSLVAEARRVAKEVEARAPMLDALINNAAIVPAAKTVTSEGFESAFATNVLSPFVLTTLLTPRLATAAPSRVINFYGGNNPTLDFDNLQGEKSYDGWAAYGQTKICNALLTAEFARRLAAQSISVNCAWPGIVNTEGMRALPGQMKWFALFMRPLMRKPADGAKTPLWLATSSELNGVTGKVFGTMFGEGKKELTMPPAVVNAENAARLYALCEGLANR